MAAAAGATDDHWYNPGGFFYGGVGPKTKSGAKVSEFNAMQLSVVWCCIKILSEDSASLPLHLYRRLPNGGKEKAIDHPAYYLLHDQPNPEMTAMSFRETLKSHVLAWGNGYAEKEYGRGRIGKSVIKALWPITPNRVTPKRNKGEIKNLPYNAIYYHINMAGTNLPNVDLPKEKILHIPGLSFNGLIGYSVIAAAREAIGLGKSLEEFGAEYFGQGIHPSIVATHTGPIKDVKAVREAINDVYVGMGKHHRAMILEEISKIEKLGIPNDEAQFLETRKFTNIDIGTRIYRLPPQMYGEYDKASTYKSAEQFSLDYVVKTLRPWLVRLEQAYNSSLLNPDERREYFFEHLIDALMRGDAQARAAFYTKLFQIAGITPNQICEIENWNPIGPEGDKRFVPLNMVPLEDAGKQQEATPSKQKNSLIYRSRIESAYSRLFSDSIGRVTRKEAQRINWLKKNHGNNGEITEFYRDFPDYIKKQVFPAFLSFTEALMSMESELNCVKYDGLRAETERFVTLFCNHFIDHYIDESKILVDSAEDFVERDSKVIADLQAHLLADNYIAHLQALTGAKS